MKVAEQLVETAVGRLNQRAATLKGDLATVALIDTNLDAFSVALEKDIEFERKQVTTPILQHFGNYLTWLFRVRVTGFNIFVFSGQKSSRFSCGEG